MIILDTDVVSEALRPAPDDRVMRWLDGQEPRTLFLTAVSLAELLAGAAYLPAGRRRSDLEASPASALTQLFDDRILPFDAGAAVAFAPMMAQARAARRSASVTDRSRPSRGRGASSSRPVTRRRSLPQEFA